MNGNALYWEQCNSTQSKKQTVHGLASLLCKADCMQKEQQRMVMQCVQCACKNKQWRFASRFDPKEDRTCSYDQWTPMNMKKTLLNSAPVTRRTICVVYADMPYHIYICIYHIFVWRYMLYHTTMCNCVWWHTLYHMYHVYGLQRAWDQRSEIRCCPRSPLCTRWLVVIVIIACVIIVSDVTRSLYKVIYYIL